MTSGYRNELDWRDERMPTVGVFAAVMDDEDRILCVKINYGSCNWTLPGGHLEKNESPVDGVKREVFEETGYEVNVTDLIGAYSAPEKDDLVLLFKAVIRKGGHFLPTDEISKIGFFHKNDLPNEMHPWNVKRITDAYSDKVSNLHIF
ncbi:NUDIX hydrolase [Bacillus sp. AK031]